MRYSVDDFSFDDAKLYAEVKTVRAVRMRYNFIVTTNEGTKTGMDGDYLCIGIEGERWPVKKEIFEKTYREV